MKHNETYFGFAITPVEAESLYRELNFMLNCGAVDDANVEALTKFRDRVLEFTKKHPCRYGDEALT